MPTPKENAYDSIISPLMTQIIAACQEYKINMFATFALDLNEDGRVLRCTTSLPLDREDAEGFALVEQLHNIVKPPPPMFSAYTIISPK